MANILIVEDEKAMQEIIADFLHKNGHNCFTADDGVDALVTLKNNPMDLMILDIMMPHLDGFSVCRMAREMSGLPIIMLTAKGEEEDKLKGYDYGADDYMTKPFSVAVLKLRLQNILSRKAKDTETKETERIITSGEIVLDLKTFRAFCGGEEFNLSMTEFRLLQYFMEHKGQALLKEQILRYVWDIEGNFVEENTLSVNVSRLRKKLGRDYIRTIQGIGYLWEENG